MRRFLLKPIQANGIKANGQSAIIELNSNYRA